MPVYKGFAHILRRLSARYDSHLALTAADAAGVPVPPSARV